MVVLLTTNLLPPSSQKAVRLEEARRIIQFFAGGIAFIIAVGLVFLVAPYLLNVLVRQELERSRALEEEASARLEVNGTTARIKATARIFDSLKKNISVSTRASRVSDEIFSRAGSGIEIQQLAVRSGENITLKGFAATRRALLEF